MSRGYRLGFETQREELVDEPLPVAGRLPDWLAGRYVGNGPGQFEVGGRRLRHWFDPLAMVRRFAVDGSEDEVSYANRYVRSRDFEYAREHGRVRTPFPGTPPDRSLPARLWQALSGTFPDNPIVGVARIGGRLTAITESPWGLELDDGLDTVGRRDLTEGLDADLTLGHPHYDPGREALVNLGVSYGRRTEFTLFRRDAATGAATPTATVTVDGAPYVHSFALTDRYAAVPATPFGFDPVALLLGAVTGRTFLDAFERFDRDARFLVIDRETGVVVAEPTADPFFVYHHANAHRDGDALVVDLVAYPDERAVTTWDGGEGVYPGEPVFVPRPGGGAEDDGVVLSLALDAGAGRSLLVVLDAATLDERARATLPHRLPYGFHGQFYRSGDPVRSMA